MKKFLCAVCLFALVLSGAGCAVSASSGQGSGAGMSAPLPAAASGVAPEAGLGEETAAPEAPFGGAAEAPICYLGQGIPLGDGNEAGYYYLSHREDASYNIKYIDYASRMEIYLCSRPECTHDNENCTAWRPYCGSEGCTIPIGDRLYTMFYGSADPADLARYGELAKMRIESSGLDGSGARELVSLPTSESLHGGVATDARRLYMTIETVEKTEDGGTRRFRQICAVDLQDGSISKSVPVERNNLIIIGAAGRKLVLRYYDVSLDDAQSLSNMSTAYCTYDVDSGAMCELAGPIPEMLFCAGEYLCWIDREQACLQKRNVLTGEMISLPVDGDLSRYEDIRPSYTALKSYGMILLYEPEQPAQYGLISLQTGEIFLLTMEIGAPEGTHNNAVPLFAEINEETFLTAQSFSHKTVLFPAGEGVIGLPEPEYELALLPVESCLANRPDFIPIQKIGS